MPEVEAVCRRLREDLELGGRRIVKARILRPSVTRPQSPSDVEFAITGRCIHAVRRIGKHILLDIDGDGPTLNVHLRMTGNLYVVPDVRFHVNSTRAWMQLDGKSGRGVIFDDPRALGKMQIRPRGARPVGTGPEPNELTASEFRTLAQSSKAPAKLFLMDQSKVSGLGNIYAAEALFRSRIHPAKPANLVSRLKIETLHREIVRLIEEAKESAYQAYSAPGGSFSEGEWFRVSVYDREGEPCHVCGQGIQRIQQGGRSTYFCPKCQR